MLKTLNLETGEDADDEIIDRKVNETPKHTPQPEAVPPPVESDQLNAATPAAPISNEFKGMLKDVPEKHGKGKKGEWTRYGLVMESGETFGTFDAKIAETAIPLIGEQVIIVFEQDKKFKNAVSISPVIE